MAFMTAAAAEERKRSREAESANQTDSPWLLLGADTDTQDTQRDTVGCCGLAAEEQVFSRMHGQAVWLAMEYPSHLKK